MPELEISGANARAPGELTFGVELDSVKPFALDSTGKLSWGSGSAPRDVSLERTGPGTLNITGTALNLNGAPIGGGGAITTATTGFLTGGDITLTTSFQNLATVSIAAVAGDTIVLTIEGMLNNVGDDTQFDAATQNPGDTNWFSTGGAASRAPGGLPSWYVRATSFEGPRASPAYVVQAGDILAGAVTVAAKAFVVSATRTLFRNANYPLRLRLDNYGQ